MDGAVDGTNCDEGKVSACLLTHIDQEKETIPE